MPTHRQVNVPTSPIRVDAPGLNTWGYGWFVTTLPPGEAGAGSTQAEMRGDLPGNFFSWILLYPQRGGVIIVLRNGYGSTERLEQNLQAILFGEEPRWPSRNAKDVTARAWQIPAAWMNAHRVWSALLLRGKESSRRSSSRSQESWHGSRCGSEAVVL